MAYHALSRVDAPPGTAVDMGLRPEHLIPCAEAEADFIAEIDVTEELGSDTLAICLMAGRELTVRLPPGHGGRPGARLPLCFDRRNLHAFDAGDGRRLDFTA